ncbi:MAG: RNA polymerase sigma factor [Planctomycetes bacterium]|nr:RNA polymerase sigma factor [Planctomycetota bacterium]
MAAQVQQGSKASFTELVNRFGPRLYHFFKGKIASKEDCEDLVQETLVKAYQNIRQYRNTWAFSTWIFTIGARRVVDFMRVRKEHKFSPLPEDGLSKSDPLESMVRREQKDHLWTRAKTLPQKQYAALYLHYREDMSIREIAKILGVSKIHTKVLLFRARSRLVDMETKMNPSHQKPKSDPEKLQNILSYR